MPGSSNTVTDNNPSISLVKTWEGAITNVTGDGLTGPNWVSWQVRIMSLLALCEVEPYVRGEIQQPNKDNDPVGHENWKRNDNFANYLITQNVSDGAIIHIQHDTTSHVAWKNLEAIYGYQSQETAVAIIENLWRTVAEEDDDISSHLTTLKEYWERLNLVDDGTFKIPEVQFKIAIICSLPPSWDDFTRPYISIRAGDSTDLKIMAISWRELIGVLKEEYVRRQRRAGKSQKDGTIHRTSLVNRIADKGTKHCGQCGMRNHETKDCRFLGQNKCRICNRFGHTNDECYSKKAKDLKRKREKNEKRGKKKRQKKEEKNQGEENEDDDDVYVFSVNEPLGG